MAVPRGYRRNSSGFIQPIGSVPSGRVSGPRAGQYGPIGTGPDAIPGMSAKDFPLPGHVREAQKKVLASYEKAQKQHEAVMNKIKAEKAALEAKEEKKVDKLQKALEAERKNAPKDKLGNTIETPLAKYLAAQLAAQLARYNQFGATPGLTPESAGMTPEQQEAMKAGPGGPGGGAFEPIPGGAKRTKLPSTQMGPVGPVPLPGGAGGMMEPGSAMPNVPTPPEVYPMNTQATHKSGAKITLMGQQRMGKSGPEYLAKGPDGQEAWVPATSFTVEGRGGPAGSGMEKLMELYRRRGPEIDPDAYVI